MTAEEWRIITQYRETVIALHALLDEIDTWTRRGFSVTNLMDKAQVLKQDILQFENILEKIPDRRARNVLRCRFALGYTIAETAADLGMSDTTVDKIIKKLKPATTQNGRATA